MYNIYYIPMFVVCTEFSTYTSTQVWGSGLSVGEFIKIAIELANQTRF